MTKNLKGAFLVLGNQLFSVDEIKKQVPDYKTVDFFMREDRELCTYFRFHKHKIIFFLAAMRAYASELEGEGLKLHYEKFGLWNYPSYERALEFFLEKKGIKKIYCFEIEDKFFEKRIVELCSRLSVDLIYLQSPMFLSSRKEFKDYLAKSKRPFMKTFYEGQRKRLSILVDKSGNPEGGKWSFDSENRLPLPKGIQPPPPRFPSTSKTVKEVMGLVEREFASHPGDAADFCFPVDRAGAKSWLKDFLKDRLDDFGTYEDALSLDSDFVFHSVLTPFLNTGLLTPQDVVDETLKYAQKKKIRLASLEGFIRQVIGWREFIRGIYQEFSEKQDRSNFWSHNKKLQRCWYEGSTGIPPLDNTIQKTLRYAYSHHIERLMVVGSLMTLLEVDPREAHKWFMEMYIDSSDWVMGPNVYGMALFSDGGIFATKPYICGSNYYRKMGSFKKGEWCDGVDGLYWRFIDKHRAFFSKNPRLSMMVKTYDKMDQSRKKELEKAATVLAKKLVI